MTEKVIARYNFSLAIEINVFVCCAGARGGRSFVGWRWTPCGERGAGGQCHPWAKRSERSANGEEKRAWQGEWEEG